jgi:mycothiol synthase
VGDVTLAREAAVAAARRRAPEGVQIRLLRDERDYAQAVAVSDAARAVDGFTYVKTAEAMASDIATLGPVAGLLVAETATDAIGWVRMFDFGVSHDVGRLLSHGGHVHPAWRGRGVGSSLLDAAQAYLRELEAMHPTDPGQPIAFETGISPGAHATIALLERRGYEPARYYIEMVRPTLDDPPPDDLPDGIEVRPTAPEHRRQVARAMNEAFRDHRAWPAFTEQQWERGLEHPLRGQLDIWQVAWEGDEVVGGVLGFIDDNENRTFGRRRGYTEQIFTRRPWRGRGIASALIGRNLRVLRDRGMTEAGLSVDTENPSGALRLYERLGFHEESRMITYRLEARPPR